MATQEGLPTPTDDDLTKRCLECNKELKPGEDIAPVPIYPGRYAHRLCRFVVLDTAFRAVGL
jgi:hypothetical protein